MGIIRKEESKQRKAHLIPSKQEACLFWQVCILIESHLGPAEASGTECPGWPDVFGAPWERQKTEL